MGARREQRAAQARQVGHLVPLPAAWTNRGSVTTGLPVNRVTCTAAVTRGMPSTRSIRRARTRAPPVVGLQGRLLPQLPHGRGGEVLTRFVLAAGQLPQAPHRPAQQHPPRRVRDDDTGTGQGVRGTAGLAGADRRDGGGAPQDEQGQTVGVVPPGGLPACAQQPDLLLVQRHAPSALRYDESVTGVITHSAAAGPQALPAAGSAPGSGRGRTPSPAGR